MGLHRLNLRSSALSAINSTIVNVSSTEFRALPYIPFFDWLPTGLVPDGSGCRRALDRFNLFIEMLVFDNAARSFRTLSRRHALPRTVTATNCLTGNDLTLLADIEEYFPTRNRPGSYHYIGPLTWESPLPAPAWWPPERKGELLAYFTMGTTWMGGSFSALYEQIRAHGITAIIATGGQAKGKEAAELQTIAGEIYVEEFVNGDLVMEACDVVVCHGGNGTIYQALQQGKPVVGIPTIPDQAFNMRRVKVLGVGESLTLKEFERSPEKLFQLTRKVATEPAYRQNARKLQEIVAGLQPAQAAADLIERHFPSC